MRRAEKRSVGYVVGAFWSVAFLICLIGVLGALIAHASTNSPIQSMSRFYQKATLKEGAHELNSEYGVLDEDLVAVQNKTYCELFIGTRVPGGKIQWKFSVAPQEAYTTKKTKDLCE